MLQLMRQTIKSCSNELQRCVASQSCSCAAVPLNARVAVQFVTSSSLEVVTHLTTNGGRDVLHYYVWVYGYGCG